jgi:energy-coupling factor transport system ATP-binding protein
VVVDGVDTRAASTAELARTVGLAFQEPDDQLFRPTVGAEVRFGPENLDRPDPDALVDAALERLRLADVRDVDTYELGRPVRRRVAVAGVLAMDTPVVVLDEPTGGQDATGVAAVGDAVESLVADGRLVVVVTHDVEFAARHADRVVAMADGRVVADGTPAETLADDALRERVGLRAPFRVRLARELGLESAVGVESLLAAV